MRLGSRSWPRLPWTVGRRKKDMSLPTATNRATAFTESIRTLRTSLQVLAPQSHAVVAVTSPEPGDGKSFVTANLAVSMSLAGRSVIVVGGDLRQGRIGHYFGARADAKGFAEAIASDADTDDLWELLCRPNMRASCYFRLVRPRRSRRICWPPIRYGV